MPRYNRRSFLQRVAFMGGGAVLLAGACEKSAERAKAQGASPQTPVSPQSFSADEYRTMSEAVDRILPRDADPGALDANVPAYIDRMLSSPDIVQLKRILTGGLAALDRRAQRGFGRRFTDLGDADQDMLLADFKDARPGSGEARFFETLVFLTMEGFLGDPSYGGNHNKVGWALVGFDVHAPSPGHKGH
ncbi:MAG: gluconate 2-dehydrogenase subunit 3 family protein [Myxococcaceae bacterium]